MSQVFMLHVENIEILDTYDREMKIAKKPVETLTPRGLHKIKIKIKKKNHSSIGQEWLQERKDQRPMYFI